MKIRMICTWDNEIKYSVKFKKELPLDILRGKLLEIEAIGEMRKK